MSIHSRPFVTLAHETKELNAKLQMGSWDSAFHRWRGRTAKNGILKNI